MGTDLLIDTMVGECEQCTSLMVDIGKQFQIMRQVIERDDTNDTLSCAEANIKILEVKIEKMKIAAARSLAVSSTASD